MSKKKKVIKTPKPKGKKPKAKKRKAKKAKVKQPKKRKSVARYKGVQYIAKALNRYFKTKYPTIKSAYPKAKEILKTLLDRGEKVSVNAIFGLVRKSRVPKVSAESPYVNPDMFNEECFFEPELLQDKYPKWISEASKDIEFRSLISPSEVSIFKGGSEVLYETHFQAFVIHCNKMFNLMREQGLVPDSDDGALLVTSPPMQDAPTGPKNDRKPGQWYCEIYPCDIFGQLQDYGFKPTDSKAPPTKFVLPNTDPSSLREETKKTEPIKAGPTQPEPPEIPQKPTEIPIKHDLELEKLKLEEETKRRIAEIESSERTKKTELKIAALDRLLANDKITIDKYFEELAKI